jgi:hypothetical protein
VIPMENIEERLLSPSDIIEERLLCTPQEYE